MMKDSQPIGIELKWTLLLIAVVVTLLIGGEACRTECEISAWYPWECTSCCGGINDAFRGKTICCGNITDPYKCLEHCKRNGFNETVTESIPCQKVCPTISCATTTSTTTTHWPLTKLTKGPNTQTRTRQPVTTTTSSTRIHDLPSRSNSDSQKDLELQLCNNGATSLLYWTMPVIALLAVVICVQCYIVYRLHRKTRHTGKVEDTRRHQSSMRTGLEDV